MVVRLLLLLAALLLVFAFLRWFTRAPPQQAARALRRAALTLAVALLVLLTVTGRLHWLFAAIGSAIAFLPRLLPLLRYVPIVGQVYKRYKAARSMGAGPAPGQTSQVQTRYVRMTLDHASGEIDGVVLEGRFKGARLSALSLEQLIEVLRECQAEDRESAQLLQAYLDNVHGAGWRGQAGVGGAASEERTPDGTMTRSEAYAILGLAPGASDEEIVAAHRRLMQRLHPDRGGSDYLAAKINQAKDLLLGKPGGS